MHNEGREQYIFGELAWPLNRIFEFDKKDGLAFSAGATATHAQRVIAPGETITTPALHLGVTKGDFDTAVRSMHDHIRRSVLYPHASERSYRVEFLMPEDTSLTLYRGKNFNEGNVKRLMDVISQLGVELFILDGPMWCSNYGEWLSPRKPEFPNGLRPLVSYAHHYLLFGLYAEPEGGRDGYTSPVGPHAPGSYGLTIGPWKDSSVFREHPDWFVEGAQHNLHFVGTEGYFVPSQHVAPVLDLTKPLAAAYFTSELQQIVGHYGLDLYRHDFNNSLVGEGSVTMRAGFPEADYWRHYEALYQAFDELRVKFPS